MTSFAFILGVVPLAIATGAGAEMRQSLGTAVFFGMLGVTGFGLVFTPAFYVVVARAVRRAKEAGNRQRSAAGQNRRVAFSRSAAIEPSGRRVYALYVCPSLNTKTYNRLLDFINARG